jgi:hypothetical protein
MAELTTADQISVSAVRLEAHVRELAERKVFRPQALQVAADDIEAAWRAQSYAVTPQAFEAYGVRCVNLEVSRTGDRSRKLSRSESELLVRDSPDAAHTSLHGRFRRRRYRPARR